MFNVPYESYENFEQGLLRYRLQVLCNTEAERRQVNAQFNQEEALKIALNKKTINEYRKESGNFSDGDKFKRSEQINDPIRKEKRSRDPLMPHGENDATEDFVYRASHSDGDISDDYDDEDGIRDTGNSGQPNPLQVLLDEYH